MTRRAYTYLERNWPDTPVFQDVAEEWCRDQSRVLLGLVWRGYDLLLGNFRGDPLSEAKEESLNYLLALKIDKCKSGDEPFRVADRPPEQAKRKRGRGSSPQPDIAFVLYDHPRSIWPMEGKMMKHEQDVSAYLSEVKDNFLTGRYATFSREGAMLGYLLEGNPMATLDHIGRLLGVQLQDHPFFSSRPHRLSEHHRAAVPNLDSPSTFACHHLILEISLA